MPVAAQTQDAGLVVAAANKPAKALAPTAHDPAKTVMADDAEAEALNATQRQSKADLKVASGNVNANLKTMWARRTRAGRAARATFGERAPDLKEFRPQG